MVASATWDKLPGLSLLKFVAIAYEFVGFDAFRVVSLYSRQQRCVLNMLDMDHECIEILSCDCIIHKFQQFAEIVPVSHDISRVDIEGRI